MKCPNCAFVVANKKDLCPRCSVDLRPYKAAHGIAISFPKLPIETLRKKEKREQQRTKATQQESDAQTSIGNLATSASLLPSTFRARTETVRLRVLQSLSPQKNSALHASNMEHRPEAPSRASKSFSSASLSAIIQKAKSSNTATTPLPPNDVQRPAKLPTKPTPPEESQALEDLEHSVRSTVEEAKRATTALPNLDYTTETPAAIAIPPTHEPIAAKIERLQQKDWSPAVAEVVAYLGLANDSELAPSIAALELEVRKFDTGVPGGKKSLASNASGLQLKPEVSQSESSASMLIDNTSLLEALREYDAATGMSLEDSISVDTTLEDPEVLAAEITDDYISEEPIAPSATRLLAASAIDGLVVIFIAILSSFAFIPYEFASRIFFEFNITATPVLPHISTFLYCLVATWILYETVFTAAGMHTVGGRIFGLEVLTEEIVELEFKESLLRALSLVVTGYTFGLGWLPALLGKRSLHDRLSKSFVNTISVVVVTTQEVFKKKVYTIAE